MPHMRAGPVQPPRRGPSVWSVLSTASLVYQDNERNTSHVINRMLWIQPLASPLVHSSLRVQQNRTRTGKCAQQDPEGGGAREAVLLRSTPLFRPNPPRSPHTPRLDTSAAASWLDSTPLRFVDTKNNARNRPPKPSFTHILPVFECFWSAVGIVSSVSRWPLQE